MAGDGPNGTLSAVTFWIAIQFGPLEVTIGGEWIDVGTGMKVLIEGRLETVFGPFRLKYGMKISVGYRLVLLLVARGQKAGEFLDCDQYTTLFSLTSVDIHDHAWSYHYFTRINMKYLNNNLIRPIHGHYS